MKQKDPQLKSGMTPSVENYDAPRSTFSQDQFGKTTEYVERQNKTLSKEASDLKSQDYKGRYS